MFKSLIGKDGALWKTGGGDESGDTAQSPPQAVRQSVPGVVVQSPVAVLTIDPEILKSTREATFDIAGSVFSRFAAESKKLEQVIADPVTRIKAVVAVLGISPGEIVSALSSTHRGALDSWKGKVASAKTAGSADKIGAREKKLQAIAVEDQRLQAEISRLQAQLQQNAEQVQILQQEIAAAQAEIDQKSQQYDAAIQATEAELAQVILTLQSIK